MLSMNNEQHSQTMLIMNVLQIVITFTVRLATNFGFRFSLGSIGACEVCIYRLMYIRFNMMKATYFITFAIIMKNVSDWNVSFSCFHN